MARNASKTSTGLAIGKFGKTQNGHQVVGQIDLSGIEIAFDGVIYDSKNKVILLCTWKPKAASSEVKIAFARD